MKQIFVLFSKNLFCFAKRAVLFRNILTLKPPILNEVILAYDLCVNVVDCFVRLTNLVKER